MKYIGITNDEKFFPSNENEIEWLGSEITYAKGIDICRDRNIKYYISDDIWKNKNKVIGDRKYIEKLMRKTSREVGVCLNELHLEKISDDNWYFLLYHWLIYYLSSFYMKYQRLMNIKIKNDDYRVILPRDFNISFKHSWDVCDYSETDDYHFFQYKMLLENHSLFHNIKIEYSIPRYESYVSLRTNISNKHRICPDIHKFVRRFFKGKVIIYQCMLDDVINKAEKQSLGKVLDLSFFADDIRYELDKLKPNFDYNLRNRMTIKLKEINKSNDSFISFINERLFEDIPFVFLEGWRDLNHLYKKYYGKQRRVKYILTNSYYTDVFKLFVVRSRERGAKLCEVQHGGDYGLINDGNNNFSFEVPDIFYSWGWKYRNRKSKIIPMSSGKLLKLNRMCIDFDTMKTGILYTASNSCGIPATFFSFREFYNSSFEKNEVDFFMKLKKEVRNRITFRPYSHSYGNDNKLMKFKQQFPEMKYDNSEDFYKALLCCELLITNKISTTYLEALYINKPCIIFYDSKFYEPEPEAIEWIEKLKSVDILIDSEERAALLINEIYNNIDMWWMEENRQCIISEFTNVYAKKDENGYNLWLDKLLSLSKE